MSSKKTRKRSCWDVCVPLGFVPSKISSTND